MEPILRRLSLGTGYNPLPVRGEMIIQVKLFATLGMFAPHEQAAKPFPYEIDNGATLKTLASEL